MSREGAEGEDDKEDGGEGYGAAAFAAGYLVLHDTERGKDDAAGLVGYGAIAAGLISGEGREQVAVGVRAWGGRAGGGFNQLSRFHTDSCERGRERSSLGSNLGASLGLIMAIPR